MAKKTTVGRPTEYNSSILTNALKYLDKCEDEIENYIKTDGDKSTSYERIVNVKIPTIEGLALYLEINRDTVYDWKQKYPAFSDIIDTLQKKQADLLINKGLSGDYNPTIAKVLLSKHGYREATELTGKDGDALKISFDPIFNK